VAVIVIVAEFERVPHPVASGGAEEQEVWCAGGDVQSGFLRFLGWCRFGVRDVGFDGEA